ncbi:MAG: hypothetical protein N3A38_04090 [Planctomycetota bacterium]|nr:hypothetical protein [Planctomycetota bacterium]
MVKRKTKKSMGTCMLCGFKSDRDGMIRHAAGCAEAHGAAGMRKAKLFVLDIRDASSPAYWMIVELEACRTLKFLDRFLRDVWLECCGHLSEFRIGAISYRCMLEEGEEYDEEGEEEEDAEEHADGERKPCDGKIIRLDAFRNRDDNDVEDGNGDEDMESAGVVMDVQRLGRRKMYSEKSMDVALSKAFKPGVRCEYMYDFGTPTELELEVVAEYEGPALAKGLRLLARNDPPEVKCSKCEAPAVELCPYCGAGGLLLCEKCAGKHDCGEDMRLPILNSPRSGVCGYEGPNEEAIRRWGVKFDG